MEEIIKNEGEEIDFIEITQKILRKWKIILKSCIISVLVAIIIIFSLPKEYTTEVQLAPEISDISTKNNLGGFAAITGIGANRNSTIDALSPDLYPDVVKSTPFLLELLFISIQDSKGKFEGNLYEYINEHQKEAWWNSLLKIPFKLLAWGRSLFSDGLENENKLDNNQIYILNKEEDLVFRSLKERINVNVDKKTYVINISVEMQDPLISAQLTHLVLEKLQNYIIDYRTQKARQDLEFTEKVYLEAKDRYFVVQRTYASFKDANKHISTAIYGTEEERHRNEMTLAFNVYNSLAQKLEQDRLRVQEQTPVFAIIEPAKLPLKPSSPRKILILFGFIFVAIVFSSSYILFKDSFSKMWKEIHEK